MAKIKNEEKTIIKSVNLGCMLIALALTILAIFAYVTIGSAGIKIAGLSLNATEFANDAIEFLDNFDGADEAVMIPSIFGLIVLMVLSVMYLVAFIKLITLVIGWFGFLGKKDSRQMALKLSKHAKKAFSIAGIAITCVFVGASYADAFTPAATRLIVITAIVAVLTFAAVRYYRWFVVEKISWRVYLFDILKNVVYMVFPLLLFTYIPLGGLGQFFNGLTLAATGIDSEFILQGTFQDLFGGMISFFTMLSFLAIVRTTLKVLPFDNYRRSAASSLKKKYITAIILPVIMIAMGAFAVSMAAGAGTLDVDIMINYAMSYIPLIVKMIVAAVAIGIVGGIEVKNEYENIKLAPVAAAPVAEAAPVEEAAPAAEAEEEEPTEEDAEEAPAEEEVSEEAIEN